MSLDYTPDELMTVEAARRLGDGRVCFVGIGLPSAAANLARLTSGQRTTLIYESGTIETRPSVLPLSIGDGELCETALTTVSVPEMFRYWLQGGRIDVGFLGGAQIDRFANLNTTVIGDYRRPSTRLPGAGGASEIASCCGEVFIIMRQNRRAFVEALDFVTSFGHGLGGSARQDIGLKTRGPTLVVTDLCVMEPDPVSRELTVTSLHPGITREKIEAATGWPIRIVPEPARTVHPSVDELVALRALQEATQRAHRVNEAVAK